MPKIIKIGQCFTELFKNNTGTVFLETRCNFAWFKRNFQIYKSFYLLTKYAKNRAILSHHLWGCVLFTSAKINLSASLGKREKKRQSIPA